MPDRATFSTECHALSKFVLTAHSDETWVIGVFKHLDCSSTYATGAGMQNNAFAVLQSTFHVQVQICGGEHFW